MSHEACWSSCESLTLDENHPQDIVHDEVPGVLDTQHL